MKIDSFVTRFALLAAGLGLLGLGSAALIGTVSTARAEGLGPEVTGGTHPYVSFTGNTPTGNTTVYTVPSNRILIVTAAVMSTSASLYQGTTLKVNGGSYAMYAISNTAVSAVLAAGRGQLVFDGGSTVVINGATSYYMQGYLAHP